MLLERQDFDGDAFLLEDPLEIVGGRRFVPRRIAGIDPDEFLKMPERLRFEASPVRLRRIALERTGPGRRQRREEEQES